MNAEHLLYETWDAAYVLGALSAHERSDYEAHLAGCAHCRAAVAELTSTAALLSRLSAEDAERTVTPPVDEAPILLREVAQWRRRSRRRRIWAVAGIAAALVIAIPMSVAVFAPRPAVEIALDSAAYVHATATVALTPTAWGTELDMACSYPAGDTVPDVTYVLAVVSADGTTTALSTWRVAPGVTARVHAATALPLTGIRSVEIRDQAGKVLLQRDLATP
ncbi:anti-sigma factor family protein [Microbacterium panaciterrae]|uniref:Zf-HC2 domain-containing protein n=1 Tax=Microbacterium panaciterrae TaxID=985759 RepID=A0ABP8PPN3_9MICO